MKYIDNSSVAGATNESTFETDRAFRLTYPVHGAPLNLDNAIDVDLLVLEALAAEFNTPHFVIRDFERIDRYGIHKDATGWILHFTHIPNSGLVIAYERINDEGPCAAVLAKEEKGGGE
ncbi:MAG: hypothetical protein OIN66_09320 [Candidatus Methanoperedens sp.]|nr:hypothetical protein [Candidatus Methanoperedens sp.]